MWDFIWNFGFEASKVSFLPIKTWWISSKNCLDIGQTQGLNGHPVTKTALGLSSQDPMVTSRITQKLVTDGDGKLRIVSIFFGYPYLGYPPMTATHDPQLTQCFPVCVGVFMERKDIDIYISFKTKGIISHLSNIPNMIHQTGQLSNAWFTFRYTWIPNSWVLSDSRQPVWSIIYSNHQLTGLGIADVWMRLMGSVWTDPSWALLGLELGNYAEPFHISITWGSTQPGT